MYTHITVFRQAHGLAGESQRFEDISTNMFMKLERSLQDCDMDKFLNVMDHLIEEHDYVPAPGDIFISGSIRMKSAAGYYVGQACCEYCVLGSHPDDDHSKVVEWIMQPYDRDSVYSDDPAEVDKWVDNPRLMLPRY